jgi:hypothetical protein
MLPGHLVCGFVGISGRDEPRVLLLPAAAAAKLDHVYVHGTHDVSRWMELNRAASALRLSQSVRYGLALSHDGLWVFANRILANRIFADRVLADWRRRHRGRLPARQIGGSGNAHHGEEPSRYDYDGLHDSIPLCWAPGRADRVTPLFRFVCARRPLLPSHVPAQSPVGNGSQLFVAFGAGLVQCDWEDREDAD